MDEYDDLLNTPICDDYFTEMPKTVNGIYRHPSFMRSWRKYKLGNMELRELKLRVWKHHNEDETLPNAAGAKKFEWGRNNAFRIVHIYSEKHSKIIILMIYDKQSHPIFTPTDAKWVRDEIQELERRESL